MIRVAEHKDLLSLFGMAREFIDESGYNLEPDDEKILKMIMNFLRDDDKIIFVMTDNTGIAVGMLAGCVTESYFSKHRVAQEIVWYVQSSYRNGLSSLKLIDAYEKWARMQRCSLVQLSNLEVLNGDKVENLYKRKGYAKKESAFLKELN